MDPNIIRGPGRSPEEFEDEGTGNNFLQKGTDPMDYNNLLHPQPCMDDAIDEVYMNACLSGIFHQACIIFP